MRLGNDRLAIALAPMRRADLESLIQICARLQTAAQEPLSIDATAEPAPRYRRELVPLLRVIGKEIRPGVYQVQLDPSIGIDPGTRPLRQGAPR